MKEQTNYQNVIVNTVFPCRLQAPSFKKAAHTLVFPTPLSRPLWPQQSLSLFCGRAVHGAQSWEQSPGWFDVSLWVCGGISTLRTLSCH